MAEGFVPKCADCIGQYISWRNTHPAGQVDDKDTPPPDIEDAVTLAPSWQMTSIMGQQIAACVAIPACMTHLGVREVSAADKAVLGGRLLLPGGTN